MDYANIVVLCAIILFLVTGVPIIPTFIMSATLFLWLSGFPLYVLGQVPFTSIDTFTFVAIPLFVMTGLLIFRGGIAEQLVELSYSIIGWVRGGLGMSSLGACGFFAAISGSNTATAACIGSIMIESLQKAGYKRSLAGALIASGACMGIIIPPSVSFIIYGIAANVSVSSLFIAGIIPGITMIIFMCVANYFICKKYMIDDPKTHFSFINVLKSFWKAKYGLLAPIIILGSIYTGIATPTESAAIAVLYCFLAGITVGNLKIKEVPGIVLESALICGIVVPVIAAATLMGQVVTMLGIPEAFVNSLLGLSTNKYIILFFIAVILLIAGMFMETIPNILIFTPLLVPVATQLGIDLTHFGIILLTTLTIGFVTPPVGLNLFVISSMTGDPVAELAVKALPYVIAMLASLVLIYCIPQLSLFLVSFMR